MPKRKVRETKTTARPRRPRYTPSRKVCAFCAGKVAAIDYKDVDRIRGFISDRAKILPRRRTGTCARHQRAVATAIKRARHLALLPYVPSQLRRVVPVTNVAPTAAAA